MRYWSIEFNIKTLLDEGRVKLLRKKSTENWKKVQLSPTSTIHNTTNL